MYCIWNVLFSAGWGMKEAENVFSHTAGPDEIIVLVGSAMIFFFIVNGQFALWTNFWQENEISGKNLSKVVKFKNLVARNML